MKTHAARLIGLLSLLVPIVVPVVAVAQPLLCGTATRAAATDHPPIKPATLVGSFRCAEEGLEITLRLDANGRFKQRFKATAVSISDAERADFAQADRVGSWRVEGRSVYLFERPKRQPTLRLVENKRDPSIRMRVEVREVDGRPAQGLFVGEGADANPQSQLNDGILTIPRTYSWEPGLRQIVREGDDRPLASFSVTLDGPNVFRFVYAPSEVEPFEFQARLVDAVGDIIAVPLGISGALLRRVP